MPRISILVILLVLATGQLAVAEGSVLEEVVHP